MNLLRDAATVVESAIGNRAGAQKEALSFFHIPRFNPKQNNKELLPAGLKSLQKEIERQQSKISSLEECLPLAKPC